jgi:hypothetical protein
MNRRHAVVALLLSLLCTQALAGTETWFRIRLGEAHIGYLLREREVDAERVVTRNTLRLQLSRNGQRLDISSDERHEETADGRPLAFASAFRAAGSDAGVEGRVLEGSEFVATLRQGADRSELRRPWPAGAVLAEGQRRALLALHAGGAESNRVLAFDPASLNALPLRSERLATMRLALADGERDSLHVRQQLGPEGAALSTELWLDATSGEVLRMRLPALGLVLELDACSQACATAPPQQADVLAATLVRSPRALGSAERRGRLAYTLDLAGASALPLGSVPGQTLVEHDADSAILLVDAGGGASDPPQADDLAPGRWLQSDHPEVAAMAARHVGGTRSALQRMRRLEAAVRAHIATKSLKVGYAAAAEVIRLREGDCTEHAVLLAALARAAGIPARVVTGFAYAPGYAGREDVFVPHAWVLAWVDERWQGFDAALPGFGAGHIGLAAGNGEPFDFYAGIDLLGKLSVRAVAARVEDLPR